MEVAAAKRRLALMMALGVGVTIVAAAAGAQTFSQVLSFQGRLCATDGVPVPDGHYTVQFTIYDAEVGGHPLWTETQGVTQIGGVFAVRLGSVSPFQPDLFADGDRWLGIKVGADPEMADRYPFTPSPWALYAASSGPDNDWTISGANIYRLGGNVGIGLNSPGYTLHVESRGERAVFADSTAAAGTNYGVYGRLASTSGAGVFGEATAATGTANGVAGFTGTLEGSGVFGQNTNSSGENEGVFGVAWSPDGKGVFGYNGASTGGAMGVLGRTNSTTGCGVRGEALRTSGVNYGVYGQSDSSSGTGVYGMATGSYGVGVIGENAGGGGNVGYVGYWKAGVLGTSVDNFGVYGASENDWAILGICPNGSGLIGVIGAIRADNGGILYSSNSGVVGSNQGGYGVTGRSLEGIGVYGRTESGTGLRAYNETSQTEAWLATPTHAAYFEGDVHTTEAYTKAYTPGTASRAMPIAYGTIDKTTGNVLVGTPNVSSTWNATYSRYEITISGESYNYNTYVTMVTPIQGSADRRAVTDAASNKLLVFIRDASGNLVQSWFSFVVYKP